MANPSGKGVKYWMTVGIKIARIKAEYVKHPRIQVMAPGTEDVTHEVPEDADSGQLGHGYEYRFEPKEYCLLTELFAEATGPATPFTRDEFRALCDQCETKDEIVAAIEGKAGFAYVKVLMVAVGIGVAAIVLMAAVALTKRRKG